MTEKKNKTVTNWLFTVSILIMAIVVFGGFVRLTRSGLSIVEWNPISGAVPPIGEEAWQQEFAAYQQSPEYQTINKNMTLESYKRIFYIEYTHRLAARIIGLIVVLPLFYYLWKGIIPWRKSFVYLAIGFLFGFQGFLGWYMVSSGLKDAPAVSHFRLTIHLSLALFLLALTFWMALQHYHGFPTRKPSISTLASYRWSLFLLVVLSIQISYGGLMAGLKAGYVSNTFPLMGGRLIPTTLLPGSASSAPIWRTLLENPTAVHFVHRWFAFVVLLAAFFVYYKSKGEENAGILKKSFLWMVGLTIVQIILGVSTIWFSVPILLALLHQAAGMILFLLAVFNIYQLSHNCDFSRQDKKVAKEVKEVGVSVQNF